MTPLRKKFSKWTLGEQQSQSSPKSPSRGLHKSLSTTFQNLANTVRQGTTYIYQDAEPEKSPQYSRTKSSRRASIFASIKSRKNACSPTRNEDNEQSPEGPDGRTSESSEDPPTLVPDRISSECPTLLGIHDESKPAFDVSFMDDVFVTREDSSASVHDPISIALPTPYQGEGAHHPLEISSISDDHQSQEDHHAVDDTGYIAENESEAEQSAVNGLFRTSSDFVAPGSSNAEISTLKSYLSQIPPSEELFESSVTAPLAEPAIPSKSVDQPYKDMIQSLRERNRRTPSEVYEADVDSSGTSREATPNMGSRTTFENGLADRRSRYLEAIGQDTATQFSQQRSKSSSSVTPEAQRSSHMPAMRLTDDDIMALGPGNTDGQDMVRVMVRVMSNSDTDISDSSNPEHDSILTHEDAYAAGMRAARFMSPSYSRPPSTPVSLLRKASSPKEATAESCAVMTNSPSCDAPPPFPTLHVRSEPASPSIKRNITALNTTPNDEIPITGPMNTGLHSRSPSTRGENLSLDTPDSTASSPLGTFNAARLPHFNTPETGSSPKSKRALRLERKASKKALIGKPLVENTTTNASPTEQGHRSFSIEQFKTGNDNPPPYIGHELAAIQNLVIRPNHAAINRDTKGVSFAEKEEIIGSSVMAGGESLGSAEE